MLKLQKLHTFDIVSCDIMGEVSAFNVCAPPLNLSKAVALLLQAFSQREKSLTSLLWLLKVDIYTFIRVQRGMSMFNAQNYSS